MRSGPMDACANAGAMASSIVAARMIIFFIYIKSIGFGWISVIKRCKNDANCCARALRVTKWQGYSAFVAASIVMSRLTTPV